MPDRISPVTAVFPRLVEVTTTPLVFSTPVAGVADAKSVGRTAGGRATARFVRVSSASLLPGNVLRRTDGQHLDFPLSPRPEHIIRTPGEPE